MKKILKIGISVVAVTLMFSFLGCEKNSSEIKEATKIERLENRLGKLWCNFNTI